MNQRFIHHFTIAEIGSLVTYRPNFEAPMYELHLNGRIGIVKEIEALPNGDQLLAVDFNYISDGNIGPVWRIKGENLAPLAQWMIDGDGKGNSLIASSIAGANNNFHFINPTAAHTI